MTAARRVRLTPPDEPLTVDEDGLIDVGGDWRFPAHALLAAGWTVTEVEPPTRAEQIEAAALALVMARGVRWSDALAPLCDALSLPADPEPPPTLPAWAADVIRAAQAWDRSDGEHEEALFGALRAIPDGWDAA